MKSCSMCVAMKEDGCQMGKPEKTRSGKRRRASYCHDFKEKTPADIRTLLAPPKKTRMVK